jgi:hypothetical protein
MFTNTPTQSHQLQYREPWATGQHRGNARDAVGFLRRFNRNRTLPESRCVLRSRPSQRQRS